MSEEELERCLQVALTAARAAGEGLVEAQRRLFGKQPSFKGRPTELVTEADLAAERVVVGQLLEAFPEHGILAEEGVLTPQGEASREAPQLWVVDPLDGTTNFVHGLPLFAVSIGMLLDGVPTVAVVHAPVMGWTFTAIRGKGAFKNDEPLRVTATAELAAALVATGFSYNRSEAGADDNVARLGRALHACRDVRRYGSAALDLCMTAVGHYDAYWELYLQPYDVAAGGLVVREAGGVVSDLSGGDNWIYGHQVLASNGALHGSMIEMLGSPSS